MPAIVNRHYGGSLWFSTPGASRKAATAASAALSPGSGSWSFAWWGNHFDASSVTKLVASFGPYSTTGWCINQYGRDSHVYVKAVPTFFYANFYLINQWVRYAITFDASNQSIKLYRNGALFATSGTSLWSGALAANDIFYLGGQPVFSSSNTGGGIADVCYAVGTLWTATDIQNDYYNGITLPGLTQRWPLDEGAGTTARETISGSLPLTLTSVTFSADSPMKAPTIGRQYGGCLDITYTTGNPGFAATATAKSSSSSALTPGGSFSFVLWYKYTQRTSGPAIFSLQIPNSTTQFGLATLGFNLRAIINPGGTQNIDTTTNPMLPGYWNRIAVTVDSSALLVCIYVNGALIKSQSVSAWSAFSTVWVALGLAPNYAQGSVGQYADTIYSNGTVWSLSDIQNDYFNNIAPPGVTHRWPLDEGAGTTARETVSGALPLTLSGSASFSADSPMKVSGLVQNVIAQSDGTYLSPWKNYQVSFAQYGGSLPSGYSNAGLVSDSVATDYHTIYQNYTIDGLVGPPYIDGVYGPLVMSAVVKKIAGNNWVALGAQNSLHYAYFDLSNGTVGTSASVSSPSILSLGDGWYKCSMQFIPIRQYNKIDVLMANGNGSAFYAGGSNQIAVCGVQVEKALSGQTTPSPYVATGSAPLTLTGPREWRQNWLRYSDDVSQTSVWTRRQLSSVVTDGTLQPNGVAMQKVVEDSTATSVHSVQQNVIVNADTKKFRTFYAILKSGTRNFACLLMDGGSQGAMFDLSNGTIGQSNLVRNGFPSMIPLGNGCYLCAITGDVANNGEQRYNAYLATSSLFAGVTYSGNGSDYIYIGQTGVTEGNQIPAHITTTTAVANASGAPRSGA